MPGPTELLVILAILAIFVIPIVLAIVGVRFLLSRLGPPASKMEDEEKNPSES